MKARMAELLSRLRRWGPGLRGAGRLGGRLARWSLRGLAVVAVLGAVGIAVGGGVLAHYAVTLPLPDHVPALAPRTSAVLKAADGSPLASTGAVKGDALTVDELPPHLVRAVLAIEDRRFYEHQGIDIVGIARAAWVNFRAGAIAEGASTITQQLARNLFLSQRRTYERKLQEMMIALWLEQRLSKDEILARYLNTIYFGAGAWGVDGAARRYFGKSARDLTVAESAILAGIIQAPSHYAPTRNFEAARQRAAVVLDAMVAAGSLSPQQAERAKQAPVTLAREMVATPGARYFADWAGSEIAALLHPGQPPVIAQTTLDPQLQALAERVVGEWLERRGADADAGQAALVAMAPDGAVLAMVGGRDYEASQFNRAVQSRRQAGSLFKLFVYVAALQAGYLPSDVMIDQPVRVGAWEPENYDQYYRGPVDLRTAFANSINSVSVQLASAVGWGRVAEVARSMGVGSPLMPVPALSLGAADVSLLEMTAAYAAVAADKQRVLPYGVRRLLVGERVVDLQPRPARQASWSRSDVLELLTAVMREGTGAASALPRPSAGKTGTSQDHRDAWFVGFTADVIVGVWVGNDDNSPMNAITGSKLPAKIWQDFMIAADKIKRDSGGPDASGDEDPLPPMASIGIDEYTQLASLSGLPEAYAARGALPQVTRPGGSSDHILQVEPRTLDTPVSGVPQVLDTGTLVVDGRVVRLAGVSGSSRFTEQMRRFIAGRAVSCRPVTGGRHRCEVGGRDLSRIVVYNGGARASSDAPPSLSDAEERARAQRRGLWGGG